MTPRVKICGLTSYEDAAAALDSGADLLGFVLAESPRRLSPEAVRDLVRRLPETALTVAVLVDPTPAQARAALRDAGVDRLQIHFLRTRPFPLRRTYPSLPARREVLDALGPLPPLLHLDAACAPLGGGSGNPADRTLARELASRTRLILAGGLTPETVAEAVRAVRPFAVDASSGLESAPGRKLPRLMKEFVDAAKR